MNSKDKKINEPLVSIIISCYNHEKYIGDAIDSVVQQSYRNIELIISDDGSTDRSREIIRNRLEELRPDFEVKLIFYETNTTFSCLEEAYNNAHGKYVSGIGGDDMMKPERIARQVDFLEKNQDKYGLCFTWVECIGSDKEKVSFFRELFNIENKPKQDFLRRLLFSGNCFNAPSFMMRREIFNKLGGYDFTLRQIQDYALWLKYLLHNEVYIIQDELTVYRVVEGSVSDTKGHADVTARAFEETVCVIYDTVYNMEADLFDELFPDDNPENHTELDIMCKKVLSYYEYSRNASNIYPGEIAARLYYSYRFVEGFTQLLHEKYKISRKAMYDFVATYTCINLALQKDAELSVLQTAHDKHRFDFANIEKSDTEMVNEILDIVDGDITKNISVDHIVALYDFCIKNGNSMSDFESLISELCKKERLFDSKS